MYKNTMEMFKNRRFLQGILFLVGLGLATGCNEYQIIQCVNRFKSAGGTETVRTEEQLTTLCDLYYPDLRSCLSPYASGCGIEMRSIFEGITNLFAYACNEGREDAVKYAGCLSKDSLVSEAKECANTMNLKLQSHLYANTETKCGYMDDYLDCATNAARIECGPGAAKYQNKAVRLEVGPLLESVGCDTGMENEITNPVYVTRPAIIHPNPTVDAYDRNAQHAKPSYDRRNIHSGNHSGCASISGILWIVGAALILQWFIR